MPLDKVRREYGWKNITAERRKRIEGYLQEEIRTLDNYYAGEVFGYCITPESDDDNELDSCWDSTVRTVWKNWKPNAGISSTG
ncbi:hypothetical protein KUBF_10590 [Bacteroides finegoldii]|nr:hypothetical protein KUBF_10590 [Bacteroides finegoldii]